MLVDPASYSKWKVALPAGQSVVAYLLERDLHQALRRLITSVVSLHTAVVFRSVTELLLNSTHRPLQPPAEKTQPALAGAVALSLLPFKAYPGPVPPVTAISAERQAIISNFSSSILTIPLLPNRTPLPALTALAGLPLQDILLHLASPTAATQLDALSLDDTANLLANLLAFSGKRVATFANGKVLSAYLNVLTTLLNRLPKEALSPKKPEPPVPAVDVTGKGKQVASLMEPTDSESEDEQDEDVIHQARLKVGTASRDPDGDVSMAGPSAKSSAPALSLDPRTLNRLASVAAQDHLISVLTLSTRFSASTRPALAAFLVSALSSFPDRRDAVLSTVMYGGPSTSGAVERGGGLLRELYRGYVRSSAAGRLLSSSERSSAILAGLEDARLAADWPALVLLAELYSRCLLTLGDDEFHSARNPLSLDEVVGLSGQLRNLAFTLYWMEDSIEDAAGQAKTVAGTRMTFEALRTLATGLLQQIYARE